MVRGPWHTRRVESASSLALLRRARDLVDRRFAEPLDLDDLAGAADMSRSHFARSFAAAYGVELVQEPAERPYGVEALFRDSSGNWIVLVEQRSYDGGSFGPS